jgi:NAD(P)-dependent dehydrogenase (short-subunit alcohol dehydrogenase family)
VAIVTGGGRGLGLAHAKLLAARGCKVVVNDPGPASTGAPSSEDPAGETVREIVAAGGVAVADRNSVLGSAGAVVETAIKAFGRLDVLVNNAGTLNGGLLAEMDAAAWQNVVDVHFKGTVDVTRAAWPHLVKSGAGRIVNTSSSGVFGNARSTNYSSAKAAIFGFTRSLAPEGRPFGINVNTIMPSAFTRMTNRMSNEIIRQALEDHFPPERVANFVAYLAHADTTLTGETFSVGGGRVGRVLLSMARPVVLKDDSPEAWAAHTGELINEDGLHSPMNLMDQLDLELAEALPDTPGLAGAALAGLAAPSPKS